MRLPTVLMILVAVGAVVVVHGATRKVDFSEDTVGQPPKGFEFGHTANAGAPAGNGASRRRGRARGGRGGGTP